MGLLDELGVTGDVDIEEVERRMEGGGLCPDGLHHAVLEAAGTKVIDGVKRGYELTFRVLAGPGAGCEVKEVVWLPKGEDTRKDQAARDRVQVFALRLGLLAPVRKNGKTVGVPVEGKHDFCDCIGAECIIEVQQEEREFVGKTGKKQKVREARLTYRPALFAVTDPTCTKVPRGGAGAAAAAVAAAGKPPAGQPVDEFEGI